ncbi:ATP-binding protein [bacterium]|nr:MAG: ATP-binding protein [bacterium]
MLALGYSAAMHGIDGYVVRVEADASPGTPSFVLVGLPDRALGESRERVRAAVANSGFRYPAGRLIVNLAPADIRKQGPGFDLALACALLAIDEQIERALLAEFVVIGELALDGTAQAVTGVLPMVLGARACGFTKIVLPEANFEEAALVEGMELYPARTLSDAVAVFCGHGAKYRRTAGAPPAAGETCFAHDFADVRGQEGAKRALEIAAAGGHNVLLVGPPGCGKTMLSRCLPSILPSLTNDEALEVTKLYSVSGLLASGTGLVRARPFRMPHHTVTQVALAGGGSPPRPGEISLAHHGVLMLDELLEFGRATIEALRQPLEEGAITVSRASGTFTFPARFMLICSANPCPCGYRGDPLRECRCDGATVARYASKLSGPLLDRLDLQIDVPRVPLDDLMRRNPAEPSSAVRARVEEARARQQARYAGCGIYANAQLPSALSAQHCKLDTAGTALLRAAVGAKRLSARGYDRILRVARTIADLAGSQAIDAGHVGEAIQYRSLERLSAKAA